MNNKWLEKTTYPAPGKFLGRSLVKDVT